MRDERWNSVVDSDRFGPFTVKSFAELLHSAEALSGATLLSRC